jgi:hypothetical protein
MDTSDKKAFVFVYLILIVIIIAIFTTPISLASIYTYSTARSDNLSTQAYYVANSGIEYALSIINYHNPNDPSTWPKGQGFDDFGGNIAISISWNPTTSSYNITSTGTVSSKARTLTVITDSSGKITSWK